MSQMGSISSAATGVGRRSIAAVPPGADIGRRYENVSVDLHSLGVNRVNLPVNVLTASTLFFTTLAAPRAVAPREASGRREDPQGERAGRDKEGGWGQSRRRRCKVHSVLTADLAIYRHRRCECYQYPIRGEVALKGAAFRISYGLLCRHLHRNIGRG